MTTPIDNKHKKLNVPNLRFPEFTGEWEKQNLESITSSVSSGKSHAADGEYNLYGSTGIIGKTDKGGYEGNLVLVARVGANAGYLQIINEKCGITDNTLIITPGQISACYIYNYLQHFNLNRLIFGSGQPLITGSMLKKVPISFGTYEEQKKIAGLLYLLDERISTQNKIIEDLKKLKSAIIENILNNCHNNKIQLGDVGIYIRGLTYSTNDVVEQKGTIVMRSNNIDNGSLLDYNNNIVRVNKQISQEQQLQNGDIVVCMANGSSALVGKSSFYDGKCLSPITVGAFCGIYRSKMPITKWLFQTSSYRRYIWNSLQGGNGAIANLNVEDILHMSFSIPDKSRTEFCTKLFSSLDTLIENNVSLCSMLYRQKEYLLQQMFI
jgi:restriction endonuclease S subunit